MSYIRINTIGILLVKQAYFGESSIWEEEEGCEGMYVEVEGYKGLEDLF